MVFRWGGPILALVVLASLLATAPPTVAQLAATCTPNDVPGETGIDHSRPGNQPPTDQVTGFDRIDIVTACFQEDDTLVAVTMTVTTAPGTPGTGQTFTYRAEFKNATDAAVVCTHTIGATSPGTTGCTATITTTTIQLKFPRAGMGASGLRLKDLIVSTSAIFVTNTGSVFTSSDRAPDTGSAFAGPAGYTMGSRAPDTLDSDGDGASDKSEIAAGTDPSSLDSDRDGLLDGATQTVPAGSAAEANFTAAGILRLDNLSFAGEAEFGTNATSPDTDGDGLLDGGDIRLPVGSPTAAYFQTFGVTSASADATTELYLGEYGYRANATERDSDQDDIPDREEVMGTRNTAYPNESAWPDFPGSTQPGNPDSDGDNLPDGAELAGTWTAPNGTTFTFPAVNPNDPDTDDDSISDYNEIIQGLNPTNRDTDGDGATDDEEISKGTDPRDASDKPVTGVAESGGGTDVAYLLLSAVALSVVILLCVVGILVRWG